MWALYLTKSGLVLRVRFREHPHLPSHSKEKEEEETQREEKGLERQVGQRGRHSVETLHEGDAESLGMRTVLHGTVAETWYSHRPLCA